MKKLITEADVKAIAKQGSNVIVKSDDCLITPLALDRIRSSKMVILERNTLSPDQYQPSDPNQSIKKRIAIGGDHTGFRIKNLLIKYLSDKLFHELKLVDFRQLIETVSGNAR